MIGIGAAGPQAPIVPIRPEGHFRGELVLSQPSDLYVARRYGWRFVMVRRHFEILTILQEAGDEMVSARKLMDGRTGRDALNTMIHRLREPLAEMHVRIECRQRHGYRLVLDPVSERVAANSFMIGGQVA